MKTLQQHLKSLQACAEACAWSKNKTATQTWNECNRPDWLLWWAGRTEANSKQAIALVACKIARTTLQFVPPNEFRPLFAIEAAERYLASPNEENKRAAASAASAAASAASAAAYAAASAASAAAYAADAAYAAASAAYAASAASAAYAAASAAYAAAYAAAREKQCSIIRQYLVQPW